MVTCLSLDWKGGFRNEQVWHLNLGSYKYVIRKNEDRYYYVHNGKRAPFKTRPYEVLKVVKEHAKVAHVLVAPAKKADNPPYDFEKHKAEVRKQLHDKVKGQYVASYAIIEKNKSVSWNDKDICHARLTGGAAAFDAIHEHYKSYTEEEKKAFHVFYNWMANESPWKDAFVTKDCQDAIDNCIEYNVNANRYVMYSCAIALRGFSEFEQQRKGWVKLVDKLSPKQVWVASLLFNLTGDGEWEYSGTTNAHRTWGSVGKHSQILGFLKDGFKHKDEMSWKDNEGGNLRCEVFIREGQPDKGASTDAVMQKHRLMQTKKVGWSDTHYVKSTDDLIILIKELFP